MADQPDDIVIRFPAQPGYLSLCRLNATAVAASLGFDIDELDELRLAVDEAVTWLLAGLDAEEATDDGGSGSVELAIAARAGRLEFRGHRSRVGLEAEAPDDLVQAILGATVDSFEIGVDDAGHRYIAVAKQSNHDG